MEVFRRSDKERDDIVNFLLKDYQCLREKLREVYDDLQSEQQSRRSLQQKNRELEDALTKHSIEQRRNMVCPISPLFFFFFRTNAVSHGPY